MFIFCSRTWKQTNKQQYHMATIARNGQQMVLAFGGKDEDRHHNSVEQFVTSSSSWSLTSTSQVPRPSCVELGNLTNINHHGGEKHSRLWCQESLSAPKIRFDLKFWNLCVNLSSHKCSWSHDPIFFTYPTSQFFKLLHNSRACFSLSLFSILENILTRKLSPKRFWRLGFVF